MAYGNAVGRANERASNRLEGNTVGIHSGMEAGSGLEWTGLQIDCVSGGPFFCLGTAVCPLCLRFCLCLARCLRLACSLDGWVPVCSRYHIPRRDYSTLAGLPPRDDAIVYTVQGLYSTLPPPRRHIEGESKIPDGTAFFLLLLLLSRRERGRDRERDRLSTGRLPLPCGGVDDGRC